MSVWNDLFHKYYIEHPSEVLRRMQKTKVFGKENPYE